MILRTRFKFAVLPVLALPLAAASVGVASSAPADSVAPEDKLYCAAFSPLPQPDDDSQGVWRVRANRWNEQWEDKYSAWLKKSIQTDFLVRFGLKADCADFAAIARAVFARINGLPILYKAESGQVLGHFSKDFSKLPTIEDWNDSNWQENMLKDQRFRAFLARIPNTISVHGIAMNTFPVQVYNPANPKEISRYFRPGVIHSSGNHVKVISDIDPNRWFSIRQLSATTPASVQKLTEYTAELDERKNPGEGILGWSWAVNCGAKGWQLVADERMPGYSTQEYEFQLSDAERAKGMHLGYYLETIARDPSMKSPPPQTVQQEMAALTAFVETRIPIAKNGYALSKQPVKVRGTDEAFQENYSTPSFDAGVSRRMAIIENVIARYGSDLKIKPEDLVKIADSMPIAIGEDDLKTTTYFFVKAYRNHALSSNPNDDLQARWGIAYLRTLMEKLPDDLKQLEATRSQVAERSRYNWQQLAQLGQADPWYVRLGRYVGVELGDPKIALERQKYLQWTGYDSAQYAAADSDYRLGRAELDSLRKLAPPARSAAAEAPTVSKPPLP